MSEGNVGNRRQFFHRTAFGIGVGLAGRNVEGSRLPQTRRDRLPREVWVATISQENFSAGTPDQTTEHLLKRMDEVAPLRPDIVCLPELASFRYLGGGREEVAKVAEKPLGTFSTQFANFARMNRCYVLCGLYTPAGEGFYNAAVLLDREGEVVGEYRKIHPTEGEIAKGVTPGPADPPVFQTDFGRIGVQICFDIEWQEGWIALQKAGAEIVFWPSAFGGGTKLNMLANLNRYFVVSSTQKGASRVCDISGQTIAWTGLWDPALCVPINLEKAFIHTWPYSSRFGEIRRKYGQAIAFTTFHDEEWTIVESLSAEVKVADVLREFEIKTYEEMVKGADAARARVLA